MSNAKKNLNLQKFKKEHIQTNRRESTQSSTKSKLPKTHQSKYAQ